MSATPHIFDRPLYVARLACASAALAQELDEFVAAELLDRLDVISRSFPESLLIAPRPKAMAKILATSAKLQTITEMAVAASEDLALAPARFDAVFSLLDVHAINDVPGHLAQIASALRPDGLAIVAFFAGETLFELRQAWLAAEEAALSGVSPRIAPMIDLRQVGALLQRAGLALPVADMVRTTLRYADALALMREIKALGFANPLADRRRGLTTPRLLLAVAEHYHQAATQGDGRLPATIDLAWATAWKPHPSQQQPLKPGSAKARLADALRPPEPETKQEADPPS